MITQETIRYVNDVLSMAHEVHNQSDVGVRIAFISFPNQGLVVIPCSVKTLLASANSYADDLIARSVDVTLKKGLPLALGMKEASFHIGYLSLMSRVAEAGAIYITPFPDFYTNIKVVEGNVKNFVGHVLQRLGIENFLSQEWAGI